MARRRRARPGHIVAGGYERTAPEIVRGRQVDLGDLSGEAVDPVLASFAYFGKQIRVNPDLTETTVIDLFERAAKVQVQDPATLTGADAIREAEKAKNHVREHIHPDDFEELWATAKANRQDLRRLMALCWEILGLISERPTSPPSGSSDGRPIISQSLPDGASSPVGDAPEIDGSWWPEGLPYNEDAIAVVERFQRQGRPDLANQIMVTQENRAAALAGRTG
jgi:hypothetical protein